MLLSLDLGVIYSLVFIGEVSILPSKSDFIKVGSIQSSVLYLTYPDVPRHIVLTSEAHARTMTQRDLKSNQTHTTTTLSKQIID